MEEIQVPGKPKKIDEEVEDLKQQATTEARNDLTACREGDQEACLRVIQYIRSGAGSFKRIGCDQKEYDTIVAKNTPIPVQ